jgi:hypothetical protein
MVTFTNGERTYMTKVPLEGSILEWAKGANATVVEYPFGAVVHTPPPPKKKAAPKG